MLGKIVVKGNLDECQSQDTKIALGPGGKTHGKELMCADICFFAFGFCVCATLGGAQGLQPTLYPRIVLDGAWKTLKCQVSNLGLPYAKACVPVL